MTGRPLQNLDLIELDRRARRGDVDARQEYSARRLPPPPVTVDVGVQRAHELATLQMVAIDRVIAGVEVRGSTVVLALEGGVDVVITGDVLVTPRVRCQDHSTAAGPRRAA